MHPSRAPSIAPGTFFVAQSWAGCITNMPGFNLRQAQVRTAGKEPGNHDLSALYAHACQNGLKSNPQILAELQYLSEIHKNYVARYPKSPGQVWLASGFDDAVDALLSDAWQHIRVV
jgi:hypothetical protein